MSWSDSFRSNEQRERDELREEIRRWEKAMAEAEATLKDRAWVRYGSAQEAIRLKADHAKATKEIKKLKKKLGELETRHR